MVINKCVDCKNKNFDFLFKTQDYISKELFLIEKCTQCGLVRTHIDSTLSSSKYYPPKYYGQKGRRFLTAIEKVIYFSRTMRGREIHRLFGKPGVILDIGCGRGIMLGYLKKIGWKVMGTEIDSGLVNISKHRGLTVYKNNDITKLPIPLKSVDVITLFHVLEHIPDPVATIKYSKRLLKPNGVMIIEVPNFSSFQAKISGSAWFHLDAPRHLFHFTKTVLESLILSNGFKIMKESTYSFEYGYFGMLQSMLNKITSQNNLLYIVFKRNALVNKTIRLKDILLNLLLLMPCVFVSIPIELLASTFHRGGVLRIVFKKP